jgi:predicted nucleic acid-binding protein
VAGNCECIITGDKDLLVLKQYAGIDILNPSDFPDYEEARGK